MANVNCTNCWNCTDCWNCTGCTSCTDCMDCTGLTGYEVLWINPVKEADNPRFTEVIAVLSAVAPSVWVTNVGRRSVRGWVYVIVPKEKVHG